MFCPTLVNHKPFSDTFQRLIQTHFKDLLFKYLQFSLFSQPMSNGSRSVMDCVSTLLLLNEKHIFYRGPIVLKNILDCSLYLLQLMISPSNKIYSV